MKFQNETRVGGPAREVSPSRTIAILDELEESYGDAETESEGVHETRRRRQICILQV
jgi:hypothetical protein